MQSNRSKYSSSPTTGIRSKKAWKKMGLFSDQVDEVPDFSSVPDHQSYSRSSERPDFSYSPQSYQEPQSGFSQPVNQYIPYAPPSRQSNPNDNGYVQGGNYNSPPVFYPDSSGFQQSDQVKPAKPTPQSVVPNPPPPSSTPSQSGKMSTAQMLTFFLAGVLPFVFIIAFFVNQIFYSFIALALVGAFVMWYRELYPASARWMISGALVLTCLFGVVKLIRLPNPGNSNLQLSSPIVIQVQATPELTAANESDLLITLPPPSPTPVVEKTEAEKRLAAFMNLWMSNSIPAMVEYTQPSWINKQSDPEQALFTLLANRFVEAFTIESVSGSETDTSRSVTMTATINKNTGKKPSVYRFTIMMVKEGEHWYVNPNSLATNDEIKDAADEIVVNDSNASGAVTEAPRTTVTPIPPGDTLLYYNPDGGSKYHRDPNCPSVRSEYLPLKGSFPYNELGAYRDTYKLSPCMKCSAPINTVPPN